MCVTEKLKAFGRCNGMKDHQLRCKLGIYNLNTKRFGVAALLLYIGSCPNFLNWSLITS